MVFQSTIISVFVEEISWGEGSLKDLSIENSFGKKFSKEDKIDVLMGADVIFWPESLDGLLQTINVNCSWFIVSLMDKQEALELNKDCLVLISFYSRVGYTNDNLDKKVKF